MKLRFLLLGALAFLLLVGVTFARRAALELPNFGYWSAKSLRAAEPQLRKEVAGPNKTSSIKLADYGSSNVALSHREADGIPEVHAHMDDYFVVQSGAATLVIGGSVVNPKQTDPGETRGETINGGERRALTTGDIVHIPANLPHQLLVAKGQAFTYFVVKVKVP